MKILTTLLLIVSVLPALAQTKDTTAMVAGKAITDKFPTTRNFDIQFDQYGSSDYTSKLLGDVYEKGTLEEHNRIKVAVNFPLYRSATKRFFITNSIRYKREAFTFRDIENTTGAVNRNAIDFHYFANAVSFTYFSSLFKKSVIYNASATLDADQNHIQRLKGIASASIVLKKNANTTLTVGGLLIMDASAIVPFVPIVTYEHQFRNSPWKIDFILPQRMLLKRPLLNNGRLSLGTELNTENFYLTLNNLGLKGTYEMNQLEIRSGLTYEYAFAKSFIGTFKTGFANVVSSRITERGERTNRYIIDNKQDPQLYFNIGLSYNPF